MADDERSQLHDIVNRLPARELPLARQLLDLLLAVPRGTRQASAEQETPEPSGDPAESEDLDAPSLSPETTARLAELSDDELLQLDELLQRDREAARLFWRERFGEELEDDPPPNDGAE